MKYRTVRLLPGGHGQSARSSSLEMRHRPRTFRSPVTLIASRKAIDASRPEAGGECWNANNSGGAICEIGSKRGASGTGSSVPTMTFGWPRWNSGGYYWGNASARRSRQCGGDEPHGGGGQYER